MLLSLIQFQHIHCTSTNATLSFFDQLHQAVMSHRATKSNTNKKNAKERQIEEMFGSQSLNEKATQLATEPMDQASTSTERRKDNVIKRPFGDFGGAREPIKRPFAYNGGTQVASRELESDGCLQVASQSLEENVGCLRIASQEPEAESNLSEEVFTRPTTEFGRAKSVIKRPFDNYNGTQEVIPRPFETNQLIPETSLLPDDCARQSEDAGEGTNANHHADMLSSNSSHNQELPMEITETGSELIVLTNPAPKLPSLPFNQNSNSRSFKRNNEIVTLGKGISYGGNGVGNILESVVKS